ncbi:hypothetical protein B0J17DRAFT_686505 [Rhizoctonia solani]|nr:hypothetical protein B0J17DRAFT_686505 [Rhizoctonia solani]
MYTQVHNDRTIAEHVYPAYFGFVHPVANVCLEPYIPVSSRLRTYLPPPGSLNLLPRVSIVTRKQY